MESIGNTVLIFEKISGVALSFLCHSETILSNMAWDKILFRRYLEEGEEILFIAHKHWISLLAVASKTAFFGFVLPWAIWMFFSGVFWGAVVWTALFWCYFLYHFIDWYFDVWIATNSSVIDLEWRGLFHHLSSRIPYSEVREVSYEIEGIIGLLLRYGNASIGMATGGQVELCNVGSPRRVSLRITEIRDRFLAEQKITQSDALQSLLTDLVSRHIDERGIRIKQS